jgi:hypothetical protein
MESPSIALTTNIMHTGSAYCAMAIPTIIRRASRDSLNARRQRPTPKLRSITLRNTKMDAQNKFRRIEGLICQLRQF